MIWKDSILYDFEVKVKQSNVAKDAGLGAFLRFRGARVLEGEQRKINNAKMSARTPVDPGTLEKLEARYQDGSGVLVTLTGNHLHGHNNSVWRTATERPLRAYYKDRSVKLKLSGCNLHYDIDEDETLGLSCCPNRIGHLRMNTESDYLHDSSIAFSTKKLGKCALLELGRYGPARKEGKECRWEIRCSLVHG